jgi:hypothetical protein
MTTFDLFHHEEQAIVALDVRPVTGMGNLQAFVTIKLGPLTIHGCRVIREDDKRPWAALPQVQNGNRWLPLIQVADSRLHDRIRAAILSAWQERAGGPAT